jgi:predicted enzyme related to lactoylglutathione lyase
MAGRPIWFELMTPNPAAVRGFYRAGVGWEIQAEGMQMPNGSEYRMIGRSDGGHAGGVLTLTPDMTSGGARPGWLTYFHVGDVDAAAARAESLGASVQMPPMTMEGVGRMAMLTDPQGAPFYVMDPTPPADRPDAQSDVWDREKAQRCRWIELATTDAPAAREFYRSLLGWQFNDVMPMGAAGDYLFIDHDGDRLGAINPMIREGQPPMWLLYFGVEEIGAALDAAKANGGTVINGPHEVPGGDHIFVATDPAGATVAFVGPKGA